MSNFDALKQFVDHLPMCRALGMSVSEGDELVFILPYSDKIIGDTQSKIIHGGAISTLLDTACGAVVASHKENTNFTATVDLRIDYMRPAIAGMDVYATAEVYQTTRHIAFVRGIAWDKDKDAPLAMATGTFTFSKKSRNRAGDE